MPRKKSLTYKTYRKKQPKTTQIADLNVQSDESDCSISSLLDHQVAQNKLDEISTQINNINLTNYNPDASQKGKKRRYRTEIELLGRTTITKPNKRRNSKDNCSTSSNDSHQTRSVKNNAEHSISMNLTGDAGLQIPIDDYEQLASKVIRGSKAQDSVSFPIISRGKQCTAMAATALVFRKIHRENNWNGQIIDQILNIGDDFYRKSIRIREQLMPEINSEYLMPTELAPNMTVLNRRYVLNTHEGDHVNGSLRTIGTEVINLHQGIAKFFVEYDSGIFICNMLSTAITKHNEMYYLFDSHSRDEYGRAWPNGKACMLEFISMDLLAEHIMRVHWQNETEANVNNYYRNVFTIAPIRIVLQDNIAEDNAVSPTALLMPPPTKVPVASSSNVRIPGHSNTYLLAKRTRQVDTFTVGDMVEQCDQCGAKFYKKERKMCCNKGNVVLPPLDEYPSMLKAKLLSDSSTSKLYLKNIMKYNTLLSFASISSTLRTDLPPGVDVFVIQGNMYHKMMHVYQNDTRPSFGQLYFLDSGRANDIRNANTVFTAEMSAELIAQLDKVIRKVNPYAGLYRNMKEVYEKARKNAARNNATVPEISLVWFDDSGIDRRVYNRPTASEEIGAIFISGNGEIPKNIELQLYLRPEVAENQTESRSLTMSHLSPLADPLSYVLLYPTGGRGWCKDIALTRQNATRKRVTLRAFYAYRFMVRDTFNPLLESAKLTQQYIVNCYTKIESNNMDYLRLNQNKLMVTNYSGLQDYLAQYESNCNVRVGHPIILPSTYYGGKRFMMEYYQDCMAIVSRFGKPTYFVTMTCNPKWPEIEKFMRPNRCAQDRPDITVRVFHLKLKELIHDIVIKQVLGEVSTFIYVVEFQKRGLPHAHILVTIRIEDRPVDANDIDSVICAEIPDPNTEPELNDLVLKPMMHGPCGIKDPTCSCMRNDDNTCSKKYPKEFRETTLPNIGRYAQYRRRNNGRSGKVKRGQRIYEDMTNQDVVPYNPWLLKKYNCHLNVELVNTTRACKYIFKYISKGSDSAILKVVHSTRNTTETANTIEAENTNKKYDEITEHIESRYLSSCEAAWRIFELPLIDKMQKIEKLPIHLEGERSVVFREGDEQVAIENAEGKFSKLEAYFILNREDEHANNIKYPDIPMYYSWNASAHKWVRRFYDKGIIISRMYTVSPKEVERMHLRILLLHVAGATSFSDLKTVDGVLYATFQESARNRQLTENDDAWIACIEECSNSKMPAQLRRLFAYLLCYCSIENALELWRKFKKHFIEDYVRRGKSEEIAEVKALRRVDNILRYLGTSLSVYGISIPETNDPINDDDDSDNDGGAQHDGNSVVAPVEEIVDRMNVEQRSYYEQVINAVLNDANRDRRFFIYGSAGCGKTYLYNTIIDLLARRNISAIVVAFTGIAALLLRGGQTAHSKFKLPIDLTAESTSTIMAQSEEAQMLRDAKLLIFDEISMARYEIIDIIDKCLRHIRQDERPFGNIVTILGGDIKQLLPIVSGGRAEQLKSLFYHCNAWHSFKHMKLNVNMRADPAELEFANWLENVGRHSPEIRVTHPRSMRNDLVQIPNECVVEDVVGAIYGDIDFKFPTFPQLLADRSIICLRNDVCTEINNKMLRRLPGDIVTVYSVDNVDSDNPEDAENFSMEFLNRIKYGGLPDHELMLKVGAPVILLRNIDARSGLVNGTRLIIKQVSQNAIIADIAFGVNKGKTVFIPKFDIKCRVDTHSVNLKRRQFPVKLSFAITVNKAQGQTLEKVGICLTTPVYAHGQLYTALSRTKRMSALKVQIRTSEHQGTAKENHINRTLARNVVYESVMDRFQ